MRLDEVVFLEVEDVLLAHEKAIERFEGSPGVRDHGLLESAVMAPRTGYYASLAELAAVYLHGLAKNHAFIDGNSVSPFPPPPPSFAHMGSSSRWTSTTGRPSSSALLRARFHATSWSST